MSQHARERTLTDSVTFIHCVEKRLSNSMLGWLNMDVIGRRALIASVQPLNGDALPATKNLRRNRDVFLSACCAEPVFDRAQV